MLIGQIGKSTIIIYDPKVGELIKTGAVCEVVMEKENGTDVGRAGAVSEYTKRKVSDQQMCQAN